jgi:hypothetical protein
MRTPLQRRRKIGAALEFQGDAGFTVRGVSARNATIAVQYEDLKVEYSVTVKAAASAAKKASTNASSAETTQAATETVAAQETPTTPTQTDVVTTPKEPSPFDPDSVILKYGENGSILYRAGNRNVILWGDGGV